MFLVWALNKQGVELRSPTPGQNPTWDLIGNHKGSLAVLIAEISP